MGAPQEARLLAHERTPAAPGSGRCHGCGVQKNFPRALTAHIGHLPKGKPIEIWFQDEARIGQKNGIARLWAKRGTRPGQPSISDIRTPIYLAPSALQRVKVPAWRCPSSIPSPCNSTLTRSAGTSTRCSCRRLLDRAGWHTTEKLIVPRNMTLIFLSSRSPEFNPVENVWQYLRQNWLSNPVFDTCQTWNNDRPETITSIGMRDWVDIG